MTPRRYQSIMVKRETHLVAKIYSATNSVSLTDMVDQAIREYIANHTRPDFAHVRADSDPVAEE